MMYISQNYILLFVLIIFVSTISLFYFYIFSRNHEKYINFWGLSWIMYALGLVSTIFLVSQPLNIPIIGIKQVCDLLNSLFLLMGTYNFIGKKIPSYWIQFTIVNIIWIALAVYYELSFVTVTLLSAAFFNIIAIVTGVMLFRFWKVKFLGKFIAISIFFIWGIHKASYPYLYTQFLNKSLEYTTELILANLLNFCIMLIYLQKIRQELEDREKLFRVLAENAQDMIYIYKLKPYPHFVYVSPSCEKIMGYKPEEFYQNPNLFFEIIHPDDKEFLDELFDPLSTFAEPLTLRWQHKSNNYVWTEQKMTFLIEKEVGPTRIEGIIRDITERKEIEQSLKVAEKSRRTLLSNISHELRTPITSIVGYTSAIKEGRFKEDQIEKYIDLIYKKSIFLQRLVQDLFQLTQYESGKTSFNFSQISIDEFITDIIEKYRYDVLQSNRNFNVTVNMREEILDASIIVDIERIDQVCSNIIFNAIKFSPPQGLIEVGLERSEDDLIISIKDTGPGIPQDDKEKIFDRFYSNKSHKENYEGSGLGLAISKEIVEYHKGSIWVESDISKGSVFYFSIPIYQS